MKKIIVTLDSDEIFALTNQSSNKLFSSAIVSVDRNSGKSIEELCSSLDGELALKRASDNMVIIRIITPAAPEITMEELAKILDTVGEYGTDGYAFGVVSNDSTDKLTADMIFEIAPCA